MIKLISFYVILTLLSCTKEATVDPNNSDAENISILVHPNQTDVSYAHSDKNHFIIRNAKNHLNTLLLFFGGSFSSPNEYYMNCEQAGTLGLDVISLSYSNAIPAASLATNTDSLAFDTYRDEIVFGNSVSENVNVNVLNSIQTRTLKLLNYLSNTYPEQNWNQYLLSSSQVNWQKIILAGHSQGAGHAGYLGKKVAAKRIVMFSGPNDFSTHFNRPAHWLSESGLTPISQQFALLHQQDEIVPFSYQVSNLRNMGLLTENEQALLVDNLNSPFSNEQVLSLTIPALSFHNSTVGAHPKLLNIWTYLFNE